VSFVGIYAIGANNMTCPVTTDNQVVCELSGPVTQATDIYIEVRPTTGAYGGWTNQVDVRSASEDPNVANNQSTVTTAVTQPDLGVASSCPDTVQSSTTSVFQCVFTVTNYGPGTATNTTFRAYSTSFARFNSYQIAGAQGTCQIFNGNTEIICDIPVIAAGETGEQAVITVNMSPAGFGTDDVVSSVNVTNPDANPENNVFREPITITFS
jgi:hypothetical protein